jgi:hypothetical protein
VITAHLLDDAAGQQLGREVADGGGRKTRVPGDVAAADGPLLHDGLEHVAAIAPFEVVLVETDAFAHFDRQLVKSLT